MKVEWFLVKKKQSTLILLKIVANYDLYYFSETELQVALVTHSR